MASVAERIKQIVAEQLGVEEDQVATARPGDNGSVFHG